MKKHLLFATTLLVATLMTSCITRRNDPYDPTNPTNPTGTIRESHDNAASMYVGITGFNNQLFHYTGDPNKRYDILNKSSLNSYTRFVNSLSMANNTSLFWAIDDNLDHLAYCRFPQDIENVSIVTFTDGLENGSGIFNDRFLDIADYEKNLEYLNKKIAGTSVQGIKLTAYSVGVQGSDVTNVKRFDNTLEQLSSGNGFNKKVENMTQLNETFKTIADDLYKQNSKPQLTVAVPPQVRKERIVFDQKPASESQIYIEAAKLKDSPLKYSNIVYKGCKSDSGTEVQGKKSETSQGSTEFVFDNFTDLNGEKLSFPRTDLWYWDGTEWAHDNEYDGINGAHTETVHKSAAIMLILDCSKSLEEQDRFTTVKEAAVKFLETLVGSSSSPSDPGTNPGTDPTPSDNNNHCWEVTLYYQEGYTETGYAWATEAEVKKGIAEWLSDPDFGISNVTYQRASANDESSCDALNGSDPEPDTQYYIKHPWGSGSDASWSWQQMSYMGENIYYYYGQWGGVGVNINTSASDNGADWFPESSIYYAENFSVGQYAYFLYYKEYNAVAVLDESSFAPGRFDARAKVKSLFKNK